MRYRYITNGMCASIEPICNFRLISHKEIGTIAKEPGATYYRVKLPDDLSLTKYECDTYSTTDDKRPIGELGYDIVMTMSDGSRKILHQSPYQSPYQSPCRNTEVEKGFIYESQRSLSPLSKDKSRY